MNIKHNIEFETFAKNFINEIINNENIVIFHHINPDGDCLGSQHAIKKWIKLNFPKKNVYAIGNNEGVFDFINWEFDEIPNDQILSNSLAIIVDANYSNRIVHSSLLVDKKIKNIIRIDHHPEEDDIDYKFRWVDSSYVASAEQISHLFFYLKKYNINEEIAELLYLGLYTDSGRFFYDKTNSRTHMICAKLMETNFEFDNLHRNLEKRTIEQINFQKDVLNNYQTKKNVIWYYISNEKANQLGISSSLRNRVDFLANIEGYDIWIFFIENEDKTIRVRLRSNSKNVRQLAIEYNGGGHIRASGAIIDNVNQIEELIDKATKI